MSDILDIKLEFLRYGPAHNQLLSPLTPYMALCGADGPVSVTLPFEHAELLNRLNRLRYDIDGHAVAASQREAELQELGKAIARVLAEVPALVSDLRAARADKSRLINIRLVISAYELGLVPFEVTMAPADTSGSGLPLLLRTVTNMTREIRRGQPLPVEWNRAPKILFAFASPPGLPQVPAQDHLEALRRAVDPWIKIAEDETKRIADVQGKLSVLPNATVRQISEACQANDFTHVHILAHGGPMPNSDNRRFGLVLSQEDDVGGGHVVVDGQSLAMAVKGLKSSGQAKQPPTVVTLATCDSGNISSVLTPGGSIAHELHVQDIPWVIASQFPLWMRASSIAVENLYRGLLAGEDPRWVLHRLRQRLRIALPQTHDWASIVAYAAITPDLDAQVDSFRSRQTKKKIEVMFARMDDLVAGAAERTEQQSPAVASELESLCGVIRADLAAWCSEAAAERNPRERAERLGLSAASEKRIAIIYSSFEDQKKSSEAYRQSRKFYLEAINAEPVNHWVMTQFLSLVATPILAAEEEKLSAVADRYRPSWLVACQLADWQLSNSTATDLAWAHGTLAELELLGSVYNAGNYSVKKAGESIVYHCKQICALATKDTFPIFSTQRQFQRYLDHWPRPQWTDLAQTAIKALVQD
jgi:hypothetical protein